MNPLPMLVADLRALRWTGLAVILLVGLAVAVGIAINAQERALRKSSAAATDDFDVLIAAPGSQTQIVMTGVFLQPEALPLLDGRILKQVLADRRVRAAAPIALGDVANGYPIIGTMAAFVTRWGRIAPQAGRVFAAAGEAVIGADVAMALDDEIVPSHGHAGSTREPGKAQPDEAEHRHGVARYRVVGRLPPLASPWDKAILVPIESVWAIHGLEVEDHDDHEHSAGRAGDKDAEPAFESFVTSDSLPGVPLIVVKPNSVADAYGLRSAYRQGGSMAFFPAEVLVSIYGALGDIRDLLVAASQLNAVLIFLVVLLLFWAIAGLRQRRYAILRALGAPRRFILLVVWLNAVSLLAAGCLTGLVAGWGLSYAAAWLIGSRTGLRAQFIFDAGDIRMVAALIVIASLMALVPAIIASRRPVIEALQRQG